MSWIVRCAFCDEKITIGKNQFKKDKNPLTEESEYVCAHCYQSFIGDLDSYYRRKFSSALRSKSWS